MSNLKIHLSYTLSIIVLGSLACYFLYSGKGFASVKKENEVTKEVADNSANACKLTCEKGYHLISPLLHVNQQSEAADLEPLKAKIMNLVADEKRLGLLSSASVHLVCLSDGKWLYTNPEPYNPGSLIKVPMLMTYLKESESNPSLLDKKITFANAAGVPVQTFTSNAIQKGHTYTVKELLRYMVVYSDNNATMLLNENVVVSDFVKTFTDLNLPEPNVTDRNYQITAKNYSGFFSVLYYATYLSKANSEYAMDLLTQSEFKDGLVKGIPPTVKVAHKFGEWGDNRMNIHEIHESGVVYLANKPYLVTIMITGTNSADLVGIVSKVSKLIYDDLSAQPVTASNL